MAERIIYINEGLHTGEITEAAHGLCESELRIVNTCLQRVYENEAVLGPNLSPVVLKASH